MSSNERIIKPRVSLFARKREEASGTSEPPATKARLLNRLEPSSLQPSKVESLIRSLSAIERFLLPLSPLTTNTQASGPEPPSNRIEDDAIQHSTLVPAPQTSKSELAQDMFSDDIRMFPFTLSDDAIAKIRIILENPASANDYLKIPTGAKQAWIRAKLTEVVGEEGFTGCFL